MIIGLVGVKGCGKSTVSEYLRTKHEFTEASFAKPLKEICSILSGISINILDPQTEYERKARETIKDSVWGMTGRQWLQKIGTELFRDNFDSDIWLKLLERQLNNITNAVVISDCRFENEYQLIKSKGGIIWVIDRPGLESDDNHASETSWKSFIDYTKDIVIKNNGTLDDLYENIDRALLYQ